LLQAATHFLLVFNMSATMARQGGCGQLELSVLQLTVNMATMANSRFSRAIIEGTQYLVKKPRAEVQEEKKRGVQCAWHNKERAAIE
jgi:hypothetical protein